MNDNLSALISNQSFITGSFTIIGTLIGLLGKSLFDIVIEKGKEKRFYSEEFIKMKVNTVIKLSANLENISMLMKLLMLKTKKDSFDDLEIEELITIFKKINIHVLAFSSGLKEDGVLFDNKRIELFQQYLTKTLKLLIEVEELINKQTKKEDSYKVLDKEIKALKEEAIQYTKTKQLKEDTLSDIRETKLITNNLQLISLEIMNWALYSDYVRDEIKFLVPGDYTFENKLNIKMSRITNEILINMFDYGLNFKDMVIKLVNEKNKPTEDAFTKLVLKVEKKYSNIKELNIITDNIIGLYVVLKLFLGNIYHFIKSIIALYFIEFLQKILKPLPLIIILVVIIVIFVVFKTTV